MHYSLLLIRKTFPTNGEISDILKPYNSEDLYNGLEENESPQNPPVFTWDYYKIGGRYNGKLKLKINEEDEKYRWKSYSNGGRNEKLFHSMLLSDMKESNKNNLFMFTEEHYYSSMGGSDGFLYVDGAYIDDILHFEDVSCYCYIDKNGNSAAIESWNGKTFVKDENFEEKLKQCKIDSKGCYALIIDIHD